jgi:catechol 2,3-dioxygenase-like lactoylglutathione lyase family enzyme
MLSDADLMAFVPVSDMARSRRFYERTLGLDVRQADDFGCVLVANGTTLRLAQVDDFVRPAFTVLGWQVASIEATVAALTAAGVTMHRYEGMGQDDAGIWGAPSGDRVAWFSDSEGNTLSVTQPGPPGLAERAGSSAISGGVATG